MFQKHFFVLAALATFVGMHTPLQAAGQGVQQRVSHYIETAQDQGDKLFKKLPLAWWPVTVVVVGSLGRVVYDIVKIVYRYFSIHPNIRNRARSVLSIDYDTGMVCTHETQEDVPIKDLDLKHRVLFGSGKGKLYVPLKSTASPTLSASATNQGVWVLDLDHVEAPVAMVVAHLQKCQRYQATKGAQDAAASKSKNAITSTLAALARKQGKNGMTVSKMKLTFKEPKKPGMGTVAIKGVVGLTLGFVAYALLRPFCQGAAGFSGLLTAMGEQSKTLMNNRLIGGLLTVALLAVCLWSVVYDVVLALLDRVLTKKTVTAGLTINYEEGTVHHHASGVRIKATDIVAKKVRFCQGVLYIPLKSKDGYGSLLSFASARLSCSWDDLKRHIEYCQAAQQEKALGDKGWRASRKSVSRVLYTLAQMLNKQRIRQLVAIKPMEITFYQAPPPRYVLRAIVVACLGGVPLYALLRAAFE